MAIELKTGAPPGAIVTTSDTGYINSEVFLAWLPKKALCPVDGHTTHSKNLNAILLARELGVVLLQLPGNTTNRSGNIQTSVDIEVDPADRYCFMCEDNMIEDMVHCMKCKSWAHSKCSGKGKKLKKYICNKYECSPSSHLFCVSKTVPTSTPYKEELKAKKEKMKYKQVIRAKRKVTVVKENEGNEKKIKKLIVEYLKLLRPKEIST
nr:unnamed protein product [Callosobruchus analis]